MNNLKYFFLVIISISFFQSTVHAQVINGYARVTNISGTTFSVTDVNEAADTFEDDEWVVVMQMQDDVNGSAANDATFGDLGSIESAGLYELRQIDSHTESGGVPDAITLKNPTTNTYNTGANMRVQIITLREFGSPDYSTTTDMAALPWDGDIGGVLAIYVPGVLTLNHNLSANDCGFEGGSTNLGGSTGCTPTGAYRVIEQDNHANKGEGIYRSTSANEVAGRGKILNGGGGGNSHNAGGGGGGNYTAGGLGGPGWNNCSPSAGGLGGIDLSSEIAVGRVFMGGGGGAGEGNNGYATEGADGGGIILLKAQEVRTTACAGVSITANGASILIAPGNDGGGGGGGAGSIIFEVDTWDIGGGCPLTISANGGDGGAVGNSGTHGGGGGGGQGVIFFSSSEPTTNVTVESLNGDGGCNNNSDPCNSQAGGGEGVDDSGVFDILTGPLPIELLSFEADLLQSGNVALNWITKSERNNDYFTLQCSADGINWVNIGEVNGAGNSVATLNYSFEDFNPLNGLSYYRLKQTDFNGAFTYSQEESIVRNLSNIHIYPNPTKHSITIQYPDINNATIIIMDGIGRQIAPLSAIQTSSGLEMDVSNFPSGVYYVVITTNGITEKLRFVVSI